MESERQNSGDRWRGTKKRRDLSRSRSRSRERRRSRSRSRGRKSRSRSKSRSWRSRSRSRSRSRRRRSRSRSRSRGRDRRRRRRSRSPKTSQRSSENAEPSNSIMVRNMPMNLTEDVLSAMVQHWGAVNVRIIVDRDSGESRGFGFIDFGTTEQAQSFLLHNPGGLSVDGRTLRLEFSRGGNKRLGGEENRMDWVCRQCEYNNFARRQQCFQCSASKTGNAVYVNPADGNSALTSGSPNSVLVVRALKPYTTEDTIRYTFSPWATVRDVRLVRSKDTGESRCYAFVEFGSTQEASIALQNSVGLTVDDAYVRVAFSRDASSIANASGGDPPRPPNISPGFVYDKPSGYWYDKQSGFYYDSTTQLYYHSASGMYYRWDLTNHQYIQVDARGVKITPKTQKIKEAATATQPPQKGGELCTAILPGVIIKKPKKTKKKSTGTDSKVVTTKVGSISMNFSTANSKKALKRFKKRKEEKLKKQKQKALQPLNPTRTPPAVGELEPPPIPEKAVIAPVNKHLDLERKACLLCQRKFGTIELLRKHEAVSKLHKKNLEVEGYKQQAKKQREKAENKMRAMKLDKKKRSFEDMVKSSLEREQERADAARVNKPIEDTNRGNRMLKAMGWAEGQGLGKSSKGITQPIQSKMMAQRAGLGSGAATPTSEVRQAGETYQQSGRSRTMKRYQQSAPPTQQAAPQKKKVTSNDYLAIMAQYTQSMCGDEEDHVRPLLK